MSILVTLGIIAVIGFIVMGIYNRLVALRQRREQSFADIDVQLKQRFDLIPQLVDTVKGYAAHEKELFEKITAARAGVKDAGSTDERIAAENMLTKAMVGIHAVAEAYPDLKADGAFQKLMAELSDIENKLAAARRFFNNATQEFNTAVEQFPAVLFAGTLGFSKQEFFEIDEDQRATYDTAPKVEF